MLLNTLWLLSYLNERDRYSRTGVVLSAWNRTMNSFNWWHKRLPTLKHKRDSTPNSLSDGYEHNQADHRCYARMIWWRTPRPMNNAIGGPWSCECSWIVLEHDDFAHTRDEILFSIVCECKLDSHVLRLLAVKSLRYGPFPDICRLLYLNQEVGPSAPR